MKLENIDKAVKLRDELANIDSKLKQMDKLRSIGYITLDSPGTDGPRAVIDVKDVPNEVAFEVRRAVMKFLQMQRGFIIEAIDKL